MTTPLATLASIDAFGGSNSEPLSTPAVVNCSPEACRQRLELWESVVTNVDVSRFPMVMHIGVQPTAEWTPVPVAVIVAELVDRDNPNAQAKVTFSRALPDFEGDRRALLWLRAFVIETVTHEIDECFLVGGDRVFDPHDWRTAVKREGSGVR